MELWQFISTDVDFDNAFGDISFIGDQLSIPNSRNKVLKQVILDRVKTGFRDYHLFPNYGADIDSHLGKGIDKNTIPTIEAVIINSLTSDNFIAAASINIYSAVIDSTLYTRMYITTPADTRISVAITYTDGDLVIE